MLFTVKTAVIAGLYAALVILLAPLSFYEFQVRIADALLLLPFLDFFGFSAVLGLTIGCAMANILSPFGIVDIVFGSLANFLACSIAWAIGRKKKGVVTLALAAIAETLVISAIVSFFILHMFGGIELTIAFIGVLVGSAISICILGIALVLFLVKGLRIS